MPRVRLYVSKQRWVEIEVPEDKAEGYKQVNRDLWHQYDIDDKEIAMSIYQKNAEPDEERMEDAIADDLPNAEEQIIESEKLADKQAMLEMLKVAVTKLKPEQQAIIRMHFYEDKSYSQIGSELGIGKQSVADRLKVILKNLKKYL